MDIAVIGCGSAGPAAALYLQRAGHEVVVFEKVPKLGPVGAGFLLQPTGMSVLGELGLLAAIAACASPVERLYCHTRRGRTLLDLRYAELGDLCGLGVNRAAFLRVLVDALSAAGVPLRMGVDIEAVDGAHVIAAGGERCGPFDLIIVADGARSELRESAAPTHRARPYAWGALWTMQLDPEDRFGGQLHQVVDGARRMIGFLPSGLDDRGQRLVSMFWSLAVDSEPALRRAGIDALREQMLRLAPKEATAWIHGLDDLGALTLAGYVDVTMRPRWHRDRVLFIGDAAHATSPQLGQGVNLALCDARELARCIDAAATIPDALDAYTRARRHHLRYYQLTSRWLTPLFQSSSRTLGWIRDIGFPLMTWFGPSRRLMTRTMCGTKRGFVRRSMPMPKLALPSAKPEI